VLTGKGDERVERTDTGAILEFITRGKKSSRGGSPNRVIFDEAMFLAEDQIQAMLPALSAQSMNDEGAPQMVYTSSAPIAESQVLHRLRNRAIDSSPARMFFAEWSCDEDADIADRDNWYQANPGLGIRISQEWIEDNEFGTLSDHAFKVERLGIPEDPAGDDQFGIENWADLANVDSSIADAQQWALAVAPDRGWASIGKAGRTSDGKLHVEWVEHRKGTGWIVERIAHYFGIKAIPIRIHKTGPESAFIAPLREQGVDVVDAPIETLLGEDTELDLGDVEPALGDGEVALVDIRFRMLQPHELAAAMSFPTDYQFAGRRDDKIRQIGNAVPVRLAAALCKAALT
jgi:hypothetical protein